MASRYPCVSGESEQAQPQSDITRFAFARSAAHEPLRFSNKQLGHASEDSDVNSIGGGEKHSLHAMGWAISLVGGSLSDLGGRTNLNGVEDKRGMGGRKDHVMPTASVRWA